MAVAMMVTIPGMTVAEYDRIDAAIGGRERLSETDGLIVHTAGEVEGGVRVFDVWESQEKLDAFMRDHVGPAAAKVGAPLEMKPEVYILHLFPG